MIAKVLPPRRWYAAAAFLTRLQWAFYRLFWWRPDIALRNSVYLDLLLLELTQLGEFPIASRALGTELLRECTSEGGGCLYCTAHLPLFAAQVRILRELDLAPNLVIALQDAIGEDGKYPLPGSKDRVLALPPNTKTLVRVKRELEAGGTVGSLLDEYAGGPLKPQLFRLAGKVRARVLFVFSELDTDNAVKLTVVTPPFPVCDTEEKVQANLVAFDRHRQRILAAFRGSDLRSQPRRS